METSKIKSPERVTGKVIKGFILFYVFVFSAANSAFSQDLKNLKNSLSTIKEEQEKIAHDELMSYIYMILGFSVVIAIAWISTVKARKRSKAENEAKIKFIQQNQAKKQASAHAHGAPGHGHTLHKARR
ncbi:MAG TPA: hypothetical protein VF868_01910 [Bacteroidia bacterium]|jgi:heme/copper-type cytochrome/quinol oxidase subunit 2